MAASRAGSAAALEAARAACRALGRGDLLRGLVLLLGEQLALAPRLGSGAAHRAGEAQQADGCRRGCGRTARRRAQRRRARAARADEAEAGLGEDAAGRGEEGHGVRAQMHLGAGEDEWTRLGARRAEAADGLAAPMAAAGGREGMVAAGGRESTGGGGERLEQTAGQQVGRTTQSSHAAVPPVAEPMAEEAAVWCTAEMRVEARSAAAAAPGKRRAVAAAETTTALAAEASGGGAAAPAAAGGAASPPSTGARRRAVVRRSERGAGSSVTGVTKPTTPAARAAGPQTRARRIIGAIAAAM